MAYYINIVGKKFGMLTVKELIERTNKDSSYLCECECGGSVTKKRSQLKGASAKNLNCGCKSRISAKAEDLTGKVFGRLTVIGRADTNSKDGKPKWVCQCSCGNKAEVSSGAIRKGQKTCSLSCGQTTHGLSNTRLHKIWRDMISRCYSISDYHGEWYGKRGIGICNEWRNDFKAFYDWATANGYADSLTIERKDNDKDYSPDNCEWKNILEQCHNRGLFKTNKSGYAGIWWVGSKKQWRAGITVNYKKVYLGYHDKIEDAIAARKEAEIKYWNKVAE